MDENVKVWDNVLETELGFGQVPSFKYFLLELANSNISVRISYKLHMPTTYWFSTKSVGAVLEILILAKIQQPILLSPFAGESGYM